MSGTVDHERRAPTELSPATLGLASLGSVVATLLVSRFGIAGTIAGAALAPVVVALVKELGRRPVDTIARLPSGTRAIVTRRPGVRWRLVGITAAVGFAVAVAAFTVPDLVAGESVVSERPTTFFSSGDDGSGSGSPADSPTRTAPDESESTTTTPDEGLTTTAPAPAPAPPVTTAPAPVPVETAPVAPVAPVAPAAPAPPQTTAPVE